LKKAKNASWPLFNEHKHK